MCPKKAARTSGKGNWEKGESRDSPEKKGGKIKGKRQAYFDGRRNDCGRIKKKM